ncbi:hypothetical protein [Kosmotoga pacifica]|uniref:hypothetical protein n=1 Tax=Kosmotoga pacifica TaxID=1330330 RepID=UPI00069CAE0E|nr:hypothetical protein [Kosmotoga pacifica]
MRKTFKIGLNGLITYTDSHTRAMAAYLNGLTELPVYWDEDELDLQAYEICVNWCIAEGIRSIFDLKARIIPRSDYKIPCIKDAKKCSRTLKAKDNEARFSSQSHSHHSTHIHSFHIGHDNK